ncbi:GPP34 family phosphoprotein [Streptomyces bambusae]|uniref:GPP34 family phosphoprotein n=1 Tax=Streptomyces bambusae TaxID=1550616 RepID=UPI001CFFDBB7|nr:GPP34 family phosphoprotein [Streptomyces bambusae]MCB5169162.1 GPP34 family phosphoprotein [Streptomyces bambusae]
MRVTLGEEIMLLALDEESGTERERAAAAWAVAAGTLVELSLAGRLSVAGGRLGVRDTAPTGIRLLDGRLRLAHDWAERRRRPSVGDWLALDAAGAAGATADSLRRRGLVIADAGARGPFPVRRVPGSDGAVERGLRARLAALPHDPRTGALAALLHAAGMAAPAPEPEGYPLPLRTPLLTAAV